jgi:hypothetical protein
VVAVHRHGPRALERPADVGERPIGPPRVELPAPLLGEEVQRRGSPRAQKSSMI